MTKAPHRQSRQRQDKPELTPEQQVEQQKQRAKLTNIILLSIMVFQGLMVLGGAAMWFILVGPVPEGSSIQTAERARLLLPAVRLMTLYSILTTLLLWLARTNIAERRPHAFQFTLAAVAALFFAFPLGTVAALFLSFFLPPRRWLDTRPQKAANPAV